MIIQELFKEKVLSFRELSPGYEDHASEVILVKTEDNEYILRSSDVVEPDAAVFWYSCGLLFGTDPRQVSKLDYINNILNSLSSLRVSRVLRSICLDKEYIIVEKLDGVMLESFMDKPRELLYEFGRNLAQIHSKSFDYTGSPSGDFKISLKETHSHFMKAAEQIVNKFYQNDIKIKNFLSEAQILLSELKQPESSSLILVDIDPYAIPYRRKAYYKSSGY